MRVVALARERLGEVRGLHYSPDIPDAMERAARSAHSAALPATERILLLYDDTLFGGADDGFVVTERRICWKALGEEPLSLPWSALEPHDVSCEDNQVFVAAGKLPITAWDRTLAWRLTGLLRELVTSLQQPSTYREAALRREPLVEEVVLALARRHLGNAKRLFLRPGIPEGKEQGAREVHAAHLSPQEPIWVLYDDTLWGSGRDGFVITPTRLCWKDFLEHPAQIPWHRLKPEAIKVSGRAIHVAGGTLSVSPQYCKARDVAKLLAAIASGLAAASGSHENET